MTSTNDTHALISHDTRIVEDLGLSVLAQLGLTQPKSLDGKPIVYIIESNHPSGKTPIVTTDATEGTNVNGKPARTIRIWLGLLDDRQALVTAVALETIKAAFAAKRVRDLGKLAVQALTSYGYEVKGTSQKGYKVISTDASLANDAALLATLPTFKCGALAVSAKAKKATLDAAKAEKAEKAGSAATAGVKATKMTVKHEVTFESACAFIAKEIAQGNHTAKEATDTINAALRALKKAQSVAEDAAADDAAKAARVA